MNVIRWMCTMRDNAQSGPNGILLYHYAHKTCSDCGIHLVKSSKNQMLFIFPATTTTVIKHIVRITLSLVS